MHGVCPGCGEEAPAELAVVYAEVHESAVERMRGGALGGLAPPLKAFEEFVGDWLEVHGRSCSAYLEQQLPDASLAQARPEPVPDELWPPLPEYLRDVLSCLLRGLRNGEITKELHISQHTLKGYRSDLIMFFEVETIAQVVAKASQLGWLEVLPGDPDATPKR